MTEAQTAAMAESSEAIEGGWQPTRRLFSTDEFQRMGEAGILDEDERVELIDGEILWMAAIGSLHFACVNFLTVSLVRGVGDRAIVSVQNPVRLPPRSEPQPDIVLFRPRADHYRKGLPNPEDVLLIIEVADTTLRYDRDTKVPRYAMAGIPEAWIVDLERERILLYRDPQGGSYQQVETVGRGGTVSPRAFPDIVLSVDDLLG
ncbi:MAG: Uma2 family endonuclease [Dehalococcoidia bacterium]